MNARAPVLFGKYQLLELLARGGMAEVFKAKSHGVEGFEKILVIKRILPELSENPQFVEMFINEAKIAVTLGHANIVQVFDLGLADASYFIAMEYVAGLDLATLSRRAWTLSRPMGFELAAYATSEVAKALDYAHRRRDADLRPLHIVHRDVSPQNVLISHEGEVKLTDFGIAKAALAVEERTSAGVVKGKYAYMSPEQARGEEVDARTDLFALGTVLYELLSGENPFHVPDSTYETLRRVREADYTPLSVAAPGVPDELAAIVERAMAPRVEDRFPNAGLLYEELVQFLFSTGRRVGGHDLAEFVADLRRLGDQAARPMDEAELRAVFDRQDTTGAEFDASQATPVEVPLARPGARRPPRRRRRLSSVIRPGKERRDVTALVVHCREPQFLTDPLVARLLKRFGGLQVERTVGPRARSFDTIRPGPPSAESAPPDTQPPGRRAADTIAPGPIPAALAAAALAAAAQDAAALEAGAPDAAAPEAEKLDVAALDVPVVGDSESDDATPAHGTSTPSGASLTSPPGIVALFGVLDPDGRDTEAAARCALRLARAARSGTQTGIPGVRIQAGIAAGRILIEVDGEPVEDDDYRALLDEAERLADRAGLGKVWIGGEGRRAVTGLFETSSTGGTADAPHVVTAERSLADATGKFIGRREELRRVGELLASANRARMKVVGVVGDPGVGKTRLLLETRRRLQLGGHDVGMYVATCARQDQFVPLHAMQEILRAILGIDEMESEADARDKVSRLRELGLAAPEIDAVSVVLGLATADVIEGPSDASQRLLSAVGKVALKLAEDRLSVFAWDGAENMDRESRELLDSMIRAGQNTRVAVLLSYRPGFDHPWADHPRYHQLNLGPMSDEDVARLTATRLGAEEVPLELLREVTAKSVGNPLYVEEYLKGLADAGALKLSDGRVTYDPRVAEVEVPKTLRGIVSSRLARLDPVQRNLLQVASVVGERFGAELLAQVTDSDPRAVTETLREMEERGIVARGSTEYDFAHQLVGDVLRASLTLESRREHHAAVAEALEIQHEDRLDDVAERLAAHWREAGDRSRAAGYHVRAADRLIGDAAYSAGIDALERAVELLRQMPTPDAERILQLHARIGELCYTSRDLAGGARRMAAAVEYAEATGRAGDLARLCMIRGRLLGNTAGSADEARHWLDRADELARTIGDPVLVRDVTLARAETEMRQGEHGRAAEHFESALQLSREIGDPAAQVRCLIPLALASASDGKIARALEALGHAKRLGDGRDRFTQCEMAKIESLVHFFAGDHRACLEAAGAALELAKEYGFHYEAAVNAHNMGEAHLRLGEYKRAFASLRYSYEMTRDRGWGKLLWSNMRVLGFIDATRFASKEGRSHVVQANEYATKNGYTWDLIQGSYYLAIIDQQRGDLDAARTGLRDVLRLAADHGFNDYLQAAENGLRALEAGGPILLPG